MTLINWLLGRKPKYKSPLAPYAKMARKYRKSRYPFHEGL